MSGEWEGNIGNGIAKTQPLAEAWGLDFRIICDWGSGHFEYSQSLPAFLGAFIRDAVKGGKTADACGGAWPMQGHGGKFAVLGFKDAEGKLIAQNPKHHLQITLPIALVAEDPNELRVAVAFDEIVPPGRPECWTHQIAGSPAVYPAEGKVDWHLVQGPGLKTGDGTLRLAFNRHGFDGYRARELVIAATYDGNVEYTRSVQQAILRFPFHPQRGKVSRVDGAFVREGAAVCDEKGKLKWLSLPPRARRPHTATICRWQRAANGETSYEFEKVTHETAFPELRRGFDNAETTMPLGTYYYWVNEWVDPVGVRKDIEWMKEVGITRFFLGTDIRQRTTWIDPWKGRRAAMAAHRKLSALT